MCRQWLPPCWEWAWAHCVRVADCAVGRSACAVLCCAMYPRVEANCTIVGVVQSVVVLHPPPALFDMAAPRPSGLSA